MCYESVLAAVLGERCAVRTVRHCERARIVIADFNTQLIDRDMVVTLLACCSVAGQYLKLKLNNKLWGQAQQSTSVDHVASSRPTKSSLDNSLFALAFLFDRIIIILKHKSFTSLYLKSLPAAILKLWRLM